MQDRYVGDIGDFGKYGLLRALCLPSHDPGSPAPSLGVVWYLVPDEDQNRDGQSTEYLRPIPGNVVLYRQCDPALYDTLGKLVSESTRSVNAVRESRILPPGTVFYEVPLSFEGIPGHGPSARGMRAAHRKSWLQGALEAVAGCELVFIDPDNGLEVPSVSRDHRRGPKYVFLDELSPYLRRGQSLILYQHIDRSGRAGSQIRKRLCQLRQMQDGCGNAFAILYHRGTSKVYLIVPTQDHSCVLFERAQRFVEGCWGQHGHYTLFPPMAPGNQEGPV